MSPEKMKHLDFIQNVTTRMNTNSFQIKGWCITIVSALLAVYASTKNCHFLLIAILPTTLFWFLDTYYLQQERKFRGLYNDVVGISESPQEIKSFAMRPDLYTKEINKKYSFGNVFWSTTIWKVYLIINAILILTFLYLKYK